MAGVALTPHPAPIADITNGWIILPEPKPAYRQAATANQVQLVPEMKPIVLLGSSLHILNRVISPPRR